MHTLLDMCGNKHYPHYLRRIRFKEPETEKILVFLTNLFGLSPKTICELYKARWQVELFFKWVKQHLRIEKFYGTLENAPVKVQSRCTCWAPYGRSLTARNAARNGEFTSLFCSPCSKLLVEC